MPLFLRGKWRVGMVAVRDIFVGQEITYDYGVRSEVWMKKQGVSTEEAESRSGGQQTMESAGKSSSGEQGMTRAGKSIGGVDCREEGQVMRTALESSSGGQGMREEMRREGQTSGVPDEIGGGSESFEECEDVEILEGPSTTPARPHAQYKRSYFWCPEMDCTSGPVQKMTQHLQKVHKMGPATASQVAKRKRRAPVEAVRLKTPNPHTRSSGLQNMGFFISKKVKVSPSAGALTTTPPGFPMDTPATSTPNRSPPTPPCTHSTLSLDGKLHKGGTFLDGFYSHLKTRAGGSRGEHSATQISRYVGKYLYSLNAHTPVEGDLLKIPPVLPYLDTVQAAGIGSSGILHRILAHKAAVQYMRLEVS